MHVYWRVYGVTDKAISNLHIGTSETFMEMIFETLLFQPSLLYDCASWVNKILFTVNINNETYCWYCSFLYVLTVHSIWFIFNLFCNTNIKIIAQSVQIRLVVGHISKFILQISEKAFYCKIYQGKSIENGFIAFSLWPARLSVLEKLKGFF